MRAVIQRVLESKVEVDDRVVGSIGKGWLVLLGIGQSDTHEDLDYIVDKICNLRGFRDPDGKMNLSVSDVDGEILVVSQFTLYGDCRKGRRPGFSDAGNPEFSNGMYEAAIEKISAKGLRVARGEFQADMKVTLVNDGPVTFILDSSKTM